MLMVGDNSPHSDDVVDMNSRMDPEKTELMKVITSSECGQMFYPTLLLQKLANFMSSVETRVEIVRAGM